MAGAQEAIPIADLGDPGEGCPSLAEDRRADPGDGATELGEQLFRFVHFVTMAGQTDVFAVMAELDLSVSQLRSLLILDGEQPERAVHELAQLLDLSVAATGRAVEVLVRAGLVSRREDELDRRVKRIAITQAGRETMQRLATAKREGLATVVEMLDEEDREALSHALERILRHAEVRSFEDRHCC